MITMFNTFFIILYFHLLPLLFLNSNVYCISMLSSVTLPYDNNDYPCKSLHRRR